MRDELRLLAVFLDEFILSGDQLRRIAVFQWSQCAGNQYRPVNGIPFSRFESQFYGDTVQFLPTVLQSALRKPSPVGTECIRSDNIRAGTQILLMNILDNAIKYTPTGGRVDIALEKASKNVSLKVHDTGIGIPVESLPYIFDRFYQVDKSRSQRSQGSGLGLSIVKKIADIHSALIDVKSEVNQGTLFQVIFPARGAGTPFVEARGAGAHFVEP